MPFDTDAVDAVPGSTCERGLVVLLGKVVEKRPKLLKLCTLRLRLHLYIAVEATLRHLCNRQSKADGMVREEGKLDLQWRKAVECLRP